MLLSVLSTAMTIYRDEFVECDKIADYTKGNQKRKPDSIQLG